MTGVQTCALPIFKMSELQARIKADLLTARKARDSASVKVYSTLYGELELISKKKNEPITDELVIATVKKFLANLKEMESQTGRVELLTIIRHEVYLLNKYIPSQLTEEEILKIVTELNPSNMGEAMKHLKGGYAGLYDGKLASQVVKTYLT